jgi:hypothetical protein
LWIFFNIVLQCSYVDDICWIKVNNLRIYCISKNILHL